MLRKFRGTALFLSRNGQAEIITLSLQHLTITMRTFCCRDVPLARGTDLIYCVLRKPDSHAEGMSLLLDGFNSCYKPSEWVADGEMEGKGFLERFHVVVTALAGVVGRMDTDTEVAAHHQHSDVETQSDTRAQSKVAQER